MQYGFADGDAQRASKHVRQQKRLRSRGLSRTHVQRGPAQRAATGLGLIAALLLPGCFVDQDQPCGENEIEHTGEEGLNFIKGCTCAPNTVRNPNGIGCSACGENSSIVGGTCTCNSGYARVTTDGPCVKSELGAACSASTPCGPEFPVCAAGGYCTTSGCATSEDCKGGYACDTSLSPPTCIRPPTGQGLACQSAASCAGFEASYCANSTCAVTNCKSGATKCFPGTACCDYSGFGLADICAPLTDGKCAGTMAPPVTP
jgi:hypothetical protein